MKWRPLLIITLFIVASYFLKQADQNKTTLHAMGGPKTFRMMVDETCGACHANTHLRPPGEYSLNSGAAARSPGVAAQASGINPFDMTGGEPRTSLVVRKPLEGSVTPHGGIKIPESHPTMQALIDWVDRGAPAADLDRPAPTAVSYAQPVGANEHFIVYARRNFKYTGFKSLRNSQAGGDIYRLKFSFDPGTGNTTILEDLNLTNLPSTDDAQHPAVSLDGTKVVFSRKVSGSPWKIWEVNADGTGGLRQVTTGSGHDIEPFYLPYLPDGTPTRAGEGGVAFLSDEHDVRDEYNTTITLSLYVADKDGGNRRQVDFNPSHSLNPELHSSGMVFFTRWEHNEHQGHNFMSVFHKSMSDYESAGTNTFGIFGEHRRTMGNSMHDVNEVLMANYGQAHDLLAAGELDDLGYGQFVFRRSNRDDIGGSVMGPVNPRLQGEANTHPLANLIAQGDNVEMMDDEVDFDSLLGITYRQPRSLLNNLYTVVVATLTHITTTTNQFTMEVSTIPHYGRWRLHTFTLDGSNKMQQSQVLLDFATGHVEDPVPLVVRPQPNKIGKPVDLAQNTGEFTSGNVTERQSDGQPRGFSASEVPTVRFLRALQKSQGRVNTGRDNDEGIATQIIGEAPVHADGSFSAVLPANVPIQFQLLDTEGRVKVSHKPWVDLMPGETMRCVGCHAPHNRPASVQTLSARQGPAHQVEANSSIKQFHFNQDVQPIFDAKCISCHDDALVQGAAGRNRKLSLVGRQTPAGTTASYQSLIGEGMMSGAYVRTQNAVGSELMWWITGLKLNDSPPTTYPTNPADSVNHKDILNEEEIKTIAQWIDTGINYRVVNNDRTPSNLAALNRGVFDASIWPYLQASCVTCHSTGGSGEMAMNLDNGELDPEDQVDPMAVVATRINYMIPEASILLRKPLDTAIGGLTHVGGQLFTGREDQNYLNILQWIQATNPAAAPGPIPTNLVSVANYPNPFRDRTNIVYGLTGAAATLVEIKIYSQNGKEIRTLPGPVTSGSTIGWNRVEWDGRDDNGKTVGNDIYFYVIKAEFGDGTKKKFRGKCVKVK